MRDAVLSVFQAARFDFGSEFLKDIPTEREQDAWKHRLRHVVDGCAPGDLVDGYERAKSERAPYAPKLAHIAAATKAIKATPLPQSIPWKRLEAPRQTASVAESAIAEARRAVEAVSAKIKARPAPGGKEIDCEVCGLTITANEAMPKMVAGSVLAVCWDCREA